MQTVQANGAREVAIVTGGAKGIGFGIAAELARSGRHVAIFDLDRASLEEAQAALSKEGREVLALSVDVTKSESVAQGVEAVIERFGRIDVLVNNAGIVRDKRKIGRAHV